MKTSYTYPLLLMLSLLFGAANAQNKGITEQENAITLTGSVVDIEKVPISYAQIIALSQTGQQLGNTFTDFYGDYNLQINKDSIPNTQLDLLILSDGFQSKKLNNISINSSEIENQIVVELDFRKVNCTTTIISSEFMLKTVLPQRRFQ